MKNGGNDLNVKFMKLLIVGAKGMLGQELKKEAGKRGLEVFAWDREEIDITDKNQAKEKIFSLRPDILINSAAYNAADKAETERDLANLLNGFAVGFLAEIAKEIRAKFVHYSTDYVFNGENKDGYKEDDLPSPISIYGQSKLLGEQEAKKAENFYIIRLSRLFGNVGSAEICKKSFVETMIKLSEENNKLEVIDEEYGSPTYATDLAQLTFDIIEKESPYGIYHGANNGACTWFGFAKEIFDILEKDVELIPINGDQFARPAKRPKYSRLLNTKLSLQRSWQDALREYLQKMPNA